MAPNTQRYDYTFTYTKIPEQKIEHIVKGSIYDMLRKDKRFSRTMKMIDMTPDIKRVLNSEHIRNGYTMFVTTDQQIPDAFMNTLDPFRAQTLINSYIVPGIADQSYLLQNGSSIYIPRLYKYNNPILIEINNEKEILVNKVGKLTESISAVNGFIHVLDNLADVSYVN